MSKPERETKYQLYPLCAASGLSERGQHPVYRKNLKQWMLKITAYADRLLMVPFQPK